MGKIDSMAYGLSDSFLSKITSVTSEIRKPLEGTGRFEVDLLKESILPKKTQTTI